MYAVFWALLLYDFGGQGLYWFLFNFDKVNQCFQDNNLKVFFGFLCGVLFCCLFLFINLIAYNNNNNIYYLQLRYQPVAVVILYVHKYGKRSKKEIKSGVLHGRHVVAHWKIGNLFNNRL
jgi:hypothetical protein